MVLPTHFEEASKTPEKCQWSDNGQESNVKKNIVGNLGKHIVTSIVQSFGIQNKAIWS